ncbi:hypothetical protein TIFTF001_036999 [Ficus carica]|uniref:Uncharacterized protein n=1 Tax=Ficus carica TaxID=3494 RepID=A0AA88JDA5_FICCA|nr:hypothetical protein TIFTF001_036999 [Ficus carica]
MEKMSRAVVRFRDQQRSSPMPSTMSVVVFLDGGGQLNYKEVGDAEGGLLLRPLDVGLPEDGALDRRAVAVPISGVVPDVVDSLGVGGGQRGLDLGGGWAGEAVHKGVGYGGAVLRGGIRVIRARRRLLLQSAMRGGGGRRAAGGGGAEGWEREREKRERGGGGGVGRPGEGGRRAGWGGWGASEAGGGGGGGCRRWVTVGEDKREKEEERGKEREKRRERKGIYRRPAGVGAGGGRPEVGSRRPSLAVGRSPATEKNLGGKDNMR